MDDFNLSCVLCGKAPENPRHIPSHPRLSLRKLPIITFTHKMP
jgi:hypothetical protein